MGDDPLSRRATALTALEQNPAWPLLAEEAAEMERHVIALLSAKLFAGDPIDQREIDHQRGVIEGLRRALAIPRRARERAERKG